MGGGAHLLEVSQQVVHQVKNVTAQIGDGTCFKFPLEGSLGVGTAAVEIGAVKFEDIPDDWTCPVCGLSKEDFSEVEE